MRQVRAGLRQRADEVFIKINGERKYLWRAVDQDGNVLVQNRRDKAAARRFFRRLMKRTGAVPRVVVTDKLRSYGAARREVMPSVEHRQLALFAAAAFVDEFRQRWVISRLADAHEK